MTNYIPITKTRYAEFCDLLKKDLPEDTATAIIEEFESASNYDPSWSRSASDPDFWKRAYARKLENARAQGLTYSQVYVKKTKK